MFEAVKKLLIEQLDLKEEDITSDKSFADDFDMDSLDMVEMLVDLEKETGVNVPSDAMTGIHTVGELVKYLENKRA
jgi:acyl carrier protein